MSIAVGIDVSKGTLDVCILSADNVLRSFQVKNSAAGQHKIIERALLDAKGDNVHFCMEATGSYHYNFACLLSTEGHRVSVENARPIKHFGIALKKLQKTDKADAKMIAQYTMVLQPKEWYLKDEDRRELSMLENRRNDILKVINSEENRLENVALTKLIKRQIKQSARHYEKQLKELPAQVKEVLSRRVDISGQVDLICSVPGFGKISAIGFLTEVGDLSRYASAEDVAAFAGLNPCHRRSGSSLHGRSRISKAGNARLRKLLYMPALSAKRCNPIIKELYDKLVAKGKSGKLALIACMRKLAMIIFGMLRSGKPFDPNYRGLTS